MTKSIFDQYFPATLQLETFRILLRPMQESDITALTRLSANPSLWTWFTRDLSANGETEKWVQQALQEKAEQKRIPFTLINKENNAICGSTSLLNLSLYDYRVEIGATWMGEDYIGSGLNKHAKFSLLSFLFGTLPFERVEFKTDVLNERSRAALRKIGAVEEAVLRSHMLMPGNRRRDSIYYSIIRPEWPSIQQHFFPEFF